MKIMHATKKYPNALGGDAVVVSNLEKQQKLSGHKVVILTSNCDEINDNDTIYKFGLKDTPAALDKITPKRLVSLVMLFFRAYKVLKVEQPDIIHTHSIDMAFFISFAARHHNIPIVHTFHIVTFYDENQSALRRKTELIFARHTKARLVTAPNKYDVDKLIATGLNAVLLPNGIDLSFWKETAKTKPDPVFTFITLGRLEKQKGYEYLIRAAARLKGKSTRPFKITILGTGSLQDSLERFAVECGVNDLLEFVGHVTPTKTRSLYLSANATIISSLYETTPLTVLESWALGVPVITTRVGIMKDVTFKQAALVVPVQNEKSLSVAMEKLLTYPEYGVKLAAHAKQLVGEFAWTNIENLAHELYVEVLA